LIWSNHRLPARGRDHAATHVLHDDFVLAPGALFGKTRHAKCRPLSAPR
jgi:hypothetical protein